MNSLLWRMRTAFVAHCAYAQGEMKVVWPSVDCPYIIQLHSSTSLLITVISLACNFFAFQFSSSPYICLIDLLQLCCVVAVYIIISISSVFPSIYVIKHIFGNHVVQRCYYSNRSFESTSYGMASKDEGRQSYSSKEEYLPGQSSVILVLLVNLSCCTCFLLLVEENFLKSVCVSIIYVKYFDNGLLLTVEFIICIFVCLPVFQSTCMCICSSEC